MCIQHFNAGTYATFISLVVPPPQIIVQPQNTTAAEPFGAHFTCSANGYGKIKFDWYKANVQENLPSKVTISEERSSEKVTSTLFIPHVVLEDEGGYFCMAKIGKVSTKSNIAYLEEISECIINVLYFCKLIVCLPIVM